MQASGQPAFKVNFCLVQKWILLYVKVYLDVGQHTYIYRVLVLESELWKDRIKDLKDPLFLLFWSGQKDLHI